MSIWIIAFLFIAAAFQGWQVFRTRSSTHWMLNKLAHSAGAHGLMLVLMAVMIMQGHHMEGWMLVGMILTALPPFIWGVADIVLRQTEGRR